MVNISSPYLVLSATSIDESLTKRDFLLVFMPFSAVVVIFNSDSPCMRRSRYRDRFHDFQVNILWTWKVSSREIRVIQVEERAPASKEDNIFRSSRKTHRGVNVIRYQQALSRSELLRRFYLGSVWLDIFSFKARRFPILTREGTSRMPTRKNISLEIQSP